MRLDSTNAAVDHDPESTGFFCSEVSKDHRPDLPRLKAVLAILDTLGMPLAALPIPGHRADDGLDQTAIIQALSVLYTGGRLKGAPFSFEARYTNCVNRPQRVALSVNRLFIAIAI